MERDLDIWLHGFAPEAREAPQLALSRVFGIPEAAAEALLATLPRVVKRDASPAQAERIVRALESIGGRAEAVPTKIVGAPVVLVGQPGFAPAPTIVRHASQAGASFSPPRELGAQGAPAETLRLGTQELAAYFNAAALEAPSVAQSELVEHAAEPHDTLVEPTPRWAAEEASARWDDLDLSPASAIPSIASPAIAFAEPGPTLSALELTPATAPTAIAPSPPPLEITRNAHDWLESVGQLPPLSLSPPEGELTGSSPELAPIADWQNPLELPAFDAPPRQRLAMRSPAMRARARSVRPTGGYGQRNASMRPTIADGLMQLARGELRAASRNHPSLAFSLILLGVTLAFMLAYAII